MNKPFISIIVPFYNVEKYARKCIESLMEQTFRNIEIILVDDGSPDNCGTIIDEYAAKDTRIKAIHKQNGGLSSARNAGLDIATADIIGFVDSDDWVEPEMYERMVAAMEKTGSDIVVCNTAYDYMNKTTYNEALAAKEAFTVRQPEALELLLDDKVFHNYVWDKIFKREIITDQFPSGVNLEDIRTTVRFFANANSVSYIPFVGYHYIQRMGSILHVHTTERCTHYLEARISQLEFLKAHNLLPQKWQYYSLRIINDGIREARDIARNLQFDNALREGFKNILKLIEPYKEECFALLKSKTQKRWKQLQLHPRLFYHTMRIGKQFQFKNNRKKRTYVYYD